MMLKKESKGLRGKASWKNKSQVTVFIILALVIVSVIVLVFIFRNNIFTTKVPTELEPVYNYYLSCVQREVANGANILGQQGGYIESPEFSPGNEYMPFSSHLGFMGLGIPYWYYISGNGIVKEQMPTRGQMEEQLEDYIEKRINSCEFSEFKASGFEVELNEGVNVDVNIEKNKIEASVKQNINIHLGETSWTGKSHSKKVQSNLGKFYDLAKKIYANNAENMFLEDYGLDVLRLYAPVDGTELGCVSKTWSVNNIQGKLISALEANIPMIKIKGDYYDLRSAENKYFVNDLGNEVDTNVNFMYSKDWPMKLEVWPSEGDVLRADPVGLQEGLGMMGFCYIPYHFVYDFSFPVLIQLYSGGELFQFPVVVLIEKNNPREALDVEGLSGEVQELCIHKNSEVKVYTYNTNLEPVEARIRYKCFDTSCEIGETKMVGGEAILTDKFPQCVNGYIIASANGYKPGEVLMSTVSEGVVDIILEKEYKLDVEIEGISGLNSQAIVTFKNNNGEGSTIAYPEQKQIKLSEGQYEVQVYVYGDVDISFSGGVTQNCVDVPRDGVSGIAGFTEEKCFDVEIPDQTINRAVSGGGTQNYYISESELSSSDKVIIGVESFGVASKVEDLQMNHNNVKIRGLDLEFE